MATAPLDDELWKLIEPLLPVRKRRLHHPGRKRIDDRRTLSGVLFVLRTGIAWQQLPQGSLRPCLPCFSRARIITALPGQATRVPPGEGRGPEGDCG